VEFILFLSQYPISASRINNGFLKKCVETVCLTKEKKKRPFTIFENVSSDFVNDVGTFLMAIHKFPSNNSLEGKYK